jgi:hypothetical protein
LAKAGYFEAKDPKTDLVTGAAVMQFRLSSALPTVFILNIVEEICQFSKPKYKNLMVFIVELNKETCYNCLNPETKETMSFYTAAKEYLKASAEEQFEDEIDSESEEFQNWLESEAEVLTSRITDTVSAYMSNEVDPPPSRDD